MASLDDDFWWRVLQFDYTVNWWDFHLDCASVMLMDSSTWRYTYQVAYCTKRGQMSRYASI